MKTEATENCLLLQRPDNSSYVLVDFTMSLLYVLTVCHPLFQKLFQILLNILGTNSTDLICS